MKTAAGEMQKVVLNPSLGVWMNLQCRAKGALQADVVGRVRDELRLDFCRAVLRALAGEPGQPPVGSFSAEEFRLLKEAGIFLEPSELPDEVLFACHPLPEGQEPPEYSASSAILNPHATLQTGSEPPESVRRLYELRDRRQHSRIVAAPGGFASGRTTVWVAEPGLWIPIPFTLDEETAAWTGRLFAREVAPDALPLRVAATLAQANVLVEPGHAERCTARWSAFCSAAAELLRRDEFAVLQGLLRGPHLLALREYTRALHDNGYFFDGNERGCDRDVLQNEVVTRSLHLGLGQLVNKITAEACIPSFSFIARYHPGSVLPRHRDRPQCVWNLSLHLDSEPLTSFEDAWPLHIESRGTATAVRLCPGDAVLYRGTENPHWRNAQSDDRWSTICFYHFVPKDFQGSLD